MSILAVYRPPNSDCSSFLSDLDATLSSLKRSASFLTCVVGDFNSNLCTWWSGQSSDAQGVALSTLMCDHDLTQLVEGPTRFSSTTASQLDLMFVDNTTVVNDCLLPPIADHSPTLLDVHLNFSRPLTASHQTWNWKCADVAGLKRCLESADWSTVFSAPNPTAAVSEWEKMLLS